MELKKIFFIALVSNIIFSIQTEAQILFESDTYAVHSDKVVQGNFVASAKSASEITSNYESFDTHRYPSTLTFKFSINCRDNEMLPGRDHIVTLQPVNGNCITEVKFGKQLNLFCPNADEGNLPENTTWTVKLDMSEVFNAFRTIGYFTFYNGEKLSKDDFKGVYIAGCKAPLSWDFSNLYGKDGARLKDDDGDDIFETVLILNKKTDKKDLAKSWNLSKDITSYPKYISNFPLSDAIYNLALEEMINAVEPDSTFRTGKEWAGVWTRDISYSIILSMAYLQPQVAKNSLMRKVKNNRIIQDTGTGGAYPVSTDRMIWAVAAWELYKVSGDRDWLNQAFLIIKNSIEDDLKNAYNKATGMVKGESSFLDWREQTYPRWMQPADIYNSECLGTNAVHYQANIVLSKMAVLLNDFTTAQKHRNIAEKIKNGMNRYLWMKDSGYYAQFLYGRTSSCVSSRSDALGEALCVLFGIANKKQSDVLSRNTPQSEFGIPCIFPHIPGIPPYHNNGIWPFVQSYWAISAAKTGNESAVMQSIAAIYRPAALFLTNKENFVAETGDFAGTQINSDNMLWSLSGNIALVHKVLFGIEFGPDKLIFRPFVPQKMAGHRILNNFKYRNAILNIEMEGFGNSIKHFEMDGKLCKSFSIPQDLKGTHRVKIILNNQHKSLNVKGVKTVFSPETPIVNQNNTLLNWESVKGASQYQIFRNGKLLTSTENNAFRISERGEYQVAAISMSGLSSFLSEPINVGIDFDELLIKDFVVNNANANCGQPDDFIEISQNVNKKIKIPFHIRKDGFYAFSISYVNGNGPVNTENKCAMRSLYIDAKFSGIFVFPQRGKDEWSNIGRTNSKVFFLKKGEHFVTLLFESENENMNGEINQAFVGKLYINQI